VLDRVVPPIRTAQYEIQGVRRSGALRLVRERKKKMTSSAVTELVRAERPLATNVDDIHDKLIELIDIISRSKFLEY
jgi:hypothetical protein